MHDEAEDIKDAIGFLASAGFVFLMMVIGSHVF